MKLLGSGICITSTFYSLDGESLLSTLDSLLFGSFMITPDKGFFKMVCSIRMGTKSWRN